MHSTPSRYATSCRFADNLEIDVTASRIGGDVQGQAIKADDNVPVFGIVGKISDASAAKPGSNGGPVQFHTPDTGAGASSHRQPV